MSSGVRNLLTNAWSEAKRRWKDFTLVGLGWTLVQERLIRWANDTIDTGAVSLKNSLAVYLRELAVFAKGNPVDVFLAFVGAFVLWVFARAYRASPTAAKPTPESEPESSRLSEPSGTPSHGKASVPNLASRTDPAAPASATRSIVVPETAASDTPIVVRWKFESADELQIVLDNLTDAPIRHNQTMVESLEWWSGMRFLKDARDSAVYVCGERIINPRPIEDHEGFRLILNNGVEFEVHRSKTPSTRVVRKEQGIWKVSLLVDTEANHEQRQDLFFSWYPHSAEKLKAVDDPRRPQRHS